MSYFKYNNKNIYYEEVGIGTPLFLLHGNTASSKMFEAVLNLYKDKYKLVLIDFLGYGRSQRLNKFPVNLWFDEAMQVIQLIEHLGYKKVNIIGTSGGAWTALNVCLERPDLVMKVIADSFNGETLEPNFCNQLREQRELSKQIDKARYFYSLCNGNDWEQVIDNDTNAFCEFAKENTKLFGKPLTSLKPEILLTGSKKDEMLEKDFEKKYSDIISKVKNGKMHLFDAGFHPAIISNAVSFANVANSFFSLDVTK
ncbi:alpha/beta hydrolase [Clostridium sp. JS66]|uniref:alpha/beta hydrolase n=1 Tax=Clostridium sp. JS66 TaxID=3064705 RepID=UPI00298DD52F|nr:alpha/beta hydrolase [Clostridium sp. JS66]WPC44440.1 alpha/beta hydrolase [Clostridium sp. JS66]